MIKKCPWCGEKEALAVEEVGDMNWHYVRCCRKKCYACGPVCKTDKSAIKAWNDGVKS